MLAYLLMTLVLLNVKNQVLRKLVKHLNSQNVNRCYTNDFKHFPFSWKVLFLFWLRVWLRLFFSTCFLPIILQMFDGFFLNFWIYMSVNISCDFRCFRMTD